MNTNEEVPEERRITFAATLAVRIDHRLWPSLGVTMGVTSASARVTPQLREVIEAIAEDPSIGVLVLLEARRVVAQLDAEPVSGTFAIPREAWAAMGRRGGKIGGQTRLRNIGRKGMAAMGRKGAEARWAHRRPVWGNQLWLACREAAMTYLPALRN